MKKIVLDTETTGLGSCAEIVEISIIDNDSGEVLIDTLVKPTSPIPVDATNIHGITDAMVADAPAWSEIHDKVQTIFDHCSELFIYNSEYDIRLIRQTADKYDLTMNASYQDITCVMRWYASVDERINYPYSDGRWFKLGAAAKLEGFNEEGESHRALYDCRMTRFLIPVLECREQYLQKLKEKRIKAKEYRESVRDRKMALVPDNWAEYPYFGQNNRPVHSKTLSRLTLSECKQAIYLGHCVSTYGDIGHLFKVEPKND